MVAYGKWSLKRVVVKKELTGLTYQYKSREGTVINTN